MTFLDAMAVQTRPKKKAVIFDIDDTLISTRERAINALNMVAKLPSMEDIPNIQCAANITAEKAPAEYGIEKALAMCHIPSSFTAEIKNQWINTFLSDKSMYSNGKVVGKPMTGAVEAVNSAVKNRFKIIYLTGRHHDPEHRDSMLRGTVDELDGYGLPLGDRTQLIMKTVPKGMPSKQLARFINDTEYKQRTLKELKGKYDIRATFDDGFKNVEMFQQLLPNATHFGLTINFSCEKFPKGTICIPNLADKKVLNVLQ